MPPPTFATAFRFRATFEFSTDSADTRFQSVSGLSVDYETEPLKEGGENRFTHQLPVRTTYADVTLKRALAVEGPLVDWCENAFRNFRFDPATVTIQLLDPAGEPLRSWVLSHAWPKKWQLSDLNAENNALAIESLTLSYRHFRTL